MGKPLIIESLTVHTAEASAEYVYSPDVTAIAGPIGCGKSSMLELIKYGLGGRAKVMPKVRDNVTHITLRVRIGTSRLQLSRALRSNTIDVIDLVSGERCGTWATTRRRNVPRASEELLALIGLDRELRVPRSIARPTGDTVRISFFDIYRYLYLDQNSIDVSVVGHDDRNLNIKRIAVFQLVYKLTNERIVALATERGRLSDHAQAARVAARNVHEFLQANAERNPLSLELERQQAEQQLASSQTLLGDLRRGSVGPSPGGALTDDITNYRDMLREVEDQAAALTRDVDKDRAVLAQLDLDEAAARRQEVASGSLTGLEFACCPRCLQAIDDREVGQGLCLLCLQHLPFSDIAIGVDLQRIHDQRKEVLGLLDEDLAGLARANREQDVIRRQLADALMRAESRRAEPAAPVLDEVVDATRKAADASARIQEIDASRARWASYNRLLSDAEEAEELASRLKTEELQLRVELEENSSKITELSRIFNDTLSSLRDPWYQEAHIDPDSYLPIVDGEPFDMVSVGGARKTLVNLAYHLANFSMSIADDDVLLPTLLIIDSPRKNVGEGAPDRGVVEAVYRRLRTLHEAKSYPPRPFQIIIADNDPPASAKNWLPKLIELDYDHPLVPGVAHEGADVETLGEGGAVEL